LENKRAWWAWRPADARSNGIDDRIILGMWLFAALLCYIAIVVAYVKDRPIQSIGIPLFLVPLMLVGASPIIRRMNRRS
jgi:hypothetical protein